MSTAVKGNATEAAVLKAFVAGGFDVLVPFGGGQAYDLVVDLGAEAFLRVQCKTARLLNNCVVFNGRSTDHGRGPQTYEGRADIYGVYFPPRRTVYLLPVASGFAPRLRLEPARNHQKRGIRLAADYEFGRWSTVSLRSLACTGRREKEVEPRFA
jgi:hypothetical protein